MTIDKTFIISLPNRLIDRLIPLIDYLKSIDLDYFTYSATKHIDGKMGLLITIENLLEECIEAKYESVLILEDDACFITGNFKEQLDTFTDQLPPNFDCCYLGVNLFQDIVHQFSPNLIKLSSGWATHAIVYSRKGMREALQSIRMKKHNHIPYDEIMVKYVQSKGNCYCTFPMLVSQKPGHSDIENKHVDWTKQLDTRFKEKTAHL